MPRLSYIIPAYNAERTLDATVRSVLSQTERAVEAVIVDDGSTDGTRHVAGALLGRRVRLVSQANGGLSAARNAGWRAAAAGRVCFLDADDTIAPTHAGSMLRAIGDADAVACGHELVGPGLQSLGWHVPALASDTSLDRLIEGNRTPVGAVVLDTARLRARLGDNAAFDESLPVVEDWDLWLRLARAGGVWAAPVEGGLFRYRLTPNSMSANTGRMWRTGLGRIAAHGGDATERGARCWSLQSLARGVAGMDRLLVAEIRATLGGIRVEDLPHLVGALRWSFARRDVVGPDSWENRMPEWTGQVMEMLRDEPLAPRIAADLAAGPHRWRTIVERAAGMVGPGGRLVIYGFGRNGRAAADAAREIGLSVSVIDADPTAVTGVSAIAPEDLGEDDVVLVTPEQRDGILARLEARSVRRIIVPDAA